MENLHVSSFESLIKTGQEFLDKLEALYRIRPQNVSQWSQGNLQPLPTGSENVSVHALSQWYSACREEIENKFGVNSTQLKSFETAFEIQRDRNLHYNPFRDEADKLNCSIQVLKVLEGRAPSQKPNKVIQHTRRQVSGAQSVNNILFLFANPSGTQELDQDSEFNRIRETIQAARYRNEFELDQLKQVSLTKLSRELNEFQPQIVHFSGHGGDSGILLFQDESEEPEWASIEAIANVFRIYNQNPLILPDRKIRVVVLSACYSEKQAKEIAKYVDVVVGMQNSIREDAATIFAAEFYGGLAYGNPVQTAFDNGKNAVDLKRIPEQDIPKLEAKQGVDVSLMLLAGNKKGKHV